MSKSDDKPKPADQKVENQAEPREQPATELPPITGTLNIAERADDFGKPRRG